MQKNLQTSDSEVDICETETEGGGSDLDLSPEVTVTSFSTTFSQDLFNLTVGEI